MQKLLTSYLFQNKSCPLPGIGSLSIKQTSAITDFGNNLITAPSATIHFTTDEINTDLLLNYVTIKSNCDTYEATEALDHFCDSFKKELSQQSSAKLPGIGEFCVDESGNITFLQEKLSAAYFLPVTAQRVIHPVTEHSIMVGDKETTNTLMTEYFNKGPVKKDLWWVWAIIVAVISIGIIIFYLSDSGSSLLFGNAAGYY